MPRGTDEDPSGKADLKFQPYPLRSQNQNQSASDSGNRTPVGDAPQGFRTNKFLSQTFNAPRYNSWSATGRNNYIGFYTPVYKINVTPPTTISLADLTTKNVTARKHYQTKPTAFELDVQNREDPTAGYATEHIYEIQMVCQYFERMDIVIKKFLGDKKPDKLAIYEKSPDKVWFDMLTNEKQWTSAPTFKDKKGSFVPPIKVFSQALAGGDGHEADLVYLEEGVNSIKGMLFGGKRISVQDAREGLKDDAEKIILKMSQAAAMAKYLNDPVVVKIYNDTSLRIFNVVKNLEAALKQTNVGMFQVLGQIPWADEYQSFERDHLNFISDQLVKLKIKSYQGACDHITQAFKDMRAAGHAAGNPTEKYKSTLDFEAMIKNSKDTIWLDADLALSQIGLLRAPGVVGASGGQSAAPSAPGPSAPGPSAPGFSAQMTDLAIHMGSQALNFSK